MKIPILLKKLTWHLQIRRNSTKHPLPNIHLKCIHFTCKYICVKTDSFCISTATLRPSVEYFILFMRDSFRNQPAEIGCCNYNSRSEGIQKIESIQRRLFGSIYFFVIQLTTWNFRWQIIIIPYDNWNDLKLTFSITFRYAKFSVNPRVHELAFVWKL